jgi:hypothetical protein
MPFKNHHAIPDQTLEDAASEPAKENVKTILVIDDDPTVLESLKF